MGKNPSNSPAHALRETGTQYAAGTALTPQITLQGPGLAAGGRLNITITINATVTVDAVTAQRRANGWLASEVGNLLLGDTPALVIADRTVWRVPVLLTSPEHGVLGQVGVVDVDAQTGDVLSDAQTLRELIERGRQLVGPTPPTTE